MRNFQDISWIRTYGAIFKSALVWFKYFTKTSCHQARWERKKGKRYIKLETNFFVKCWHKNFVWSCYKQIKNCIAYINFFTTNCLCKKQVNWRKCRLISDIIEISGRFNTTRFFETMDIEKAFDSFGQFSYVRL